MDCYNNDCFYFDPKYLGNCWDVGEVEDCERAFTKEGWRMHKVRIHAEYLSVVNWKKLSLEALEKIKEVYMEDYKTTNE